jgi:hypothetical protein
LRLIIDDKNGGDVHQQKKSYFRIVK